MEQSLPQQKMRCTKASLTVITLGALLTSLVLPALTPQTAQAVTTGYTVFQYTKPLRHFTNRNAAVSYAKLWDHSKVLSANDNAIVWANSPHYAVYQYDKLLKEFPIYNDALAYAKRWDHAKLVNLDNGYTVWDNWPKNAVANTGSLVNGKSGVGSSGSASGSSATDSSSNGNSRNGILPLGSTSFKTLDLRKPSDIQASEIDNFIRKKAPNSPLISMGSVFLTAQNEYHVNAEYLAAHAILESYYGQTQIAHDKYNLYGYHAFDSDPYGLAAIFTSFTHSIDYEAYFVATQYLDPNGKWYGSKYNSSVLGSTLVGMNVCYATDPQWADKITAIMNQMHPYNATYYATAMPMTPPSLALRPALPVIPSTSVSPSASSTPAIQPNHL